MKIVDFFNGDYMKVITGIISILAFGISVYNLISAILKNKVSLNISVPKISKAVTGNVQLAIIDIVNKSEKTLLFLIYLFLMMAMNIMLKDYQKCFRKKHAKAKMKL